MVFLFYYEYSTVHRAPRRSHGEYCPTPNTTLMQGPAQRRRHLPLHVARVHPRVALLLLGGVPQWTHRHLHRRVHLTAVPMLQHAAPCSFTLFCLLTFVEPQVAHMVRKDHPHPPFQADRPTVRWDYFEDAAEQHNAAISDTAECKFEHYYTVI